MRYLALPVVEAAARAASLQGVSRVALSSAGFLPAYRAAAGRPHALTPYWQRRRDGFVARHVAQARKQREPLWKAGAPTRRHLALAVWAASPTPIRLARWLAAEGYLR